MFGMRPRGMFGNRNMNMGSGLVATPEQQAETARLTDLLGTQGMVAPDQRSPFGMQQQPQDIPRFQQTLMDAPPMQQPQVAEQRGLLGINPRTASALSNIGALLMSNAGNPMGAQIWQANRQQGLLNQQAKQRQQLAELEASQPDYRTVGNQVVRIDPRTGQAQVVHQGQGGGEVFEDNSGNRWERGPDGTPRLIFYDPTPRFDSNVTYNDRGEQVLIRTPRPNGFNPDGTPATMTPAAPSAAPSGPAVGTIRNGYRFNGGNPNDRNSWTPVGAGGQTATPSGGFR